MMASIKKFSRLLSEFLLSLMLFSCSHTYSIVLRDFSTCEHEDVILSFTSIDDDITLVAETTIIRVPWKSSYSGLEYGYPIKARVDEYITLKAGRVLEVFIIDADLSTGNRESDLQSGIFHVKENPEAFAYTVSYREGNYRESVRTWCAISLDSTVIPSESRPPRHPQELYPILQTEDYTFDKTLPHPFNALTYGYILRSHVSGNFIWIDDNEI